MRTLKLYLHGWTMGTRPSATNHKRGKRGKVEGWSEGATRRNIAFLRSVEPDSLTNGPEGPLIGFAVTLTVRDCPDSAESFHKARRAYLMRLDRMGLYRCHWSMEWQARRVPHLHMAVWFPIPESPTEVAMLMDRIIDHWLAVAEPYGVGRRAQDIKPIHDAVGWFQYVAKHSARGVKHYQRSAANIPEGWKSTGRVWGKTGDWVTRDAMQFDISDDVYFKLRRFARGWRLADARAAGDAYRIKTAREMLKCPDPEFSKLRGISEWISLDMTLTMLDVARGSGSSIEQVWASGSQRAERPETRSPRPLPEDSLIGGT